MAVQELAAIFFMTPTRKHPFISLLFLLPFLAPAMPSRAQETKPPARGTPVMETHIFSVPPGIFADVAESIKAGGLKPIAGLRLLHDGSSQQYDATAVMKQWGVTFPPGSMAIYEADAGVLVIRDTRPNIDLVAEADNGGFTTRHPIQIELSVVECTFPRDADPLSLDWPTSHAIDLLPPESKKLLDHVAVAGTSGSKAMLNHVVNPAPGHEAGATTFAPGESGILSTLEPSEGRDAYGANIAFQFLRQGTGRDGKGTIFINFTTSFEAWNDLPVVIYISSAPDADGKFICVIARMRRVNPAGGKLDANGKSARDTASSPKK